MRISLNTRYLGIILIILSIALFVMMYNFSQATLDLIDSGGIVCGEGHETCPHVEVLNQAYLGYFLALIILIIGVFLVIFGGKPPAPEGKENKWEETLKTLTGDEKEIYGKAMESEGVIFQSDLVEKSGFPKAKVSRILDRMEARGLLERKRRGMTNAVVLK